MKLEHRGQAQQKLVSVGLHMGYMCCILLEQLWVLLVGMDQRLLHLQFNNGFHINNTTINISGCTVFEISFFLNMHTGNLSANEIKCYDLYGQKTTTNKLQIFLPQLKNISCIYSSRVASYIKMFVH